MATSAQHTELVNNLNQFLARYYHEDIATLAKDYPRRQTLHIDITDLFAYAPELTDDLQTNPGQVLDALEEAVRVHDHPVDVSLTDVNVSITGWTDDESLAVGGYSSRQIGDYVPLQGQVAKVGMKQPDPVKAVFVCQRCGTEQEVPQTGEEFQEPYQCKSCERKGPFKFDQEKSRFRDRQQIRLQQPPEHAKGRGATIDLTVYDDLTETVEPGDRATIGGVLSVADPSDERKYVMEGNSIQPEDTDYDDVAINEHRERFEALANGHDGDPIDQLVASLAPRVHGHDELKEALLLQLFGANRVVYPDGSSDRGEFHVLLLGDPGTAKSTLLRSVKQLAPRATFTSGEGASKVGLTAAVVPDDFGDGKWSLEAGALVKANDGICCVDELDKADEDAVEGLHSALEDQIVTVSKASFSGVELQARTALLAAGNPKYGRFDQHEPAAKQIEMSPTLMSRFDLMFMIHDQPDETRDVEVADAMIHNRQAGIANQSGKQVDSDARIEPAVEPEVVRAWIAYARQNVAPVLEPGSREHEVLRDQFIKFRLENGTDPDHPVPVTYRQLEAYERLAEASARVRLSETVEMQDVRRAIRLVKRSMEDVGVDPDTGEYDADIVETGESRSQRQRVKAVESRVRELQAESSTGAANQEHLVEDLVADGFDADRVEGTIENLKKQGELYSPSENALRWFN